MCVNLGVLLAEGCWSSQAAGALGNLSADRMGLEALAYDASGYVTSLMKVIRSSKVSSSMEPTSRGNARQKNAVKFTINISSL